MNLRNIKDIYDDSNYNEFLYLEVSIFPIYYVKLYKI
jgi:hypothetical protein